MNDLRSRARAPRLWEAPAIDSLRIAATANSSGYNADYKGLHLNRDPLGIALAPPADAAHTSSAKTVWTAGVAPLGTAAEIDPRTWEAPAVATLSIDSTAAKR
jgi:hypothetical protein